MGAETGSKEQHHCKNTTVAATTTIVQVVKNCFHQNVDLVSNNRERSAVDDCDDYCCVNSQ